VVGCWVVVTLVVVVMVGCLQPSSTPLGTPCRTGLTVIISSHYFGIASDFREHFIP
jgi:hypothetical protein